MKHIDFFFSGILAVLLALLVVLTSSPIGAQPLATEDGITIVYQFTIGEPDEVGKSEIVPMHYFKRKSIFMKAPQEESVDYNSDDINNLSIAINSESIYKQFYFIDREAKMILAQEPLLDEVFNVEEGIPQFEWRITGKQKITAENNCYEATTSFRGRSYSVWFTPDIPLDVGPWKFSGLPGAILQVNDKEGRYNWYCKSISSLSTENKALIQAPENKDTYSFSEFQILAQEKVLAYLHKRLGGAGLKIDSNPNYSSSLERPIK
jgi:GLPGLI family protein